MKNSQHRRPLWIGFIVSVLTIPVLVAVPAIVAGDPFIALIVVLIGTTISMLANVLVVVPLVYWLRKNGKLYSSTLYLIGIIVGAIALALASFNLNYYPQIHRDGYIISVVYEHAIPSLLYGGVAGLLSALAFCVGAGVALNPIRTKGLL